MTSESHHTRLPLHRARRSGDTQVPSKRPRSRRNKHPPSRPHRQERPAGMATHRQRPKASQVRPRTPARQRIDPRAGTDRRTHGRTTEEAHRVAPQKAQPNDTGRRETTSRSKSRTRHPAWTAPEAHRHLKGSQILMQRLVQFDDGPAHPPRKT